MAVALDPADLSAYPPLAQAFATRHIALLRKLPPVFGALLMNEIVGYDWRFPAERADLDRQLAFLDGLDQAAFAAAMASFAALPLSPALASMRWAAAPAEFVEKLTAHLWAAQRMDNFREAANAYQRTLVQAQPEPVPATPRLCVVIVGKDAPPATFALFQKLRPQGTYFNRVQPAGGLDAVFAGVAARARAHPQAYGHWYVDGGSPHPVEPGSAVRTISYESLQPVRSALLRKVDTVRTAGEVVGPEDLRSLLAALRPDQLGAEASSADPLQRRFELSLLTEGSGTQIFSTTFVQWAGRELLRRARPLTLVLRYAPRQAERAMNEMLRVEDTVPRRDPAGSLVDADLGAYYTWINLMRLPGAAQAGFVAWFEDRQEALAAGPSMARGATSSAACDLSQVLHWAS